MSDMYKREPQELTGPGGDQQELRTKYIDNGDGTWSVSVGAVSFPLPTGASTAAKQDTTNIKLDDILDGMNAGFANNVNITTNIGTDVITQTDGLKTYTVTISGNTITEVWS